MNSIMISPLHFDHEKLDPDQYRVGEGVSGLATSFEHEHEDEDEHEEN
jgi:hypothetical protein